MKLLISGALGRMGRAVREGAANISEIEVVCGVDLFAGKAEAPFPVYATFAEVKETPDCIIDFSSPDTLDSLLAYAIEKGVPAVLTTTGYTPEQTEQINVASEKVALFRSANMSVGVNVLAELCKKAAARLPQFDVEIVEMHHNQKADAPSGTALMLADAIKEIAPEKYYVYGREGRPGKRNAAEIGIHAVRGGSVVGNHDVILAGPNEIITLSHTATSRAVFADGALRAALYLATKKTGLYNMSDMLSETQDV